MLHLGFKVVPVSTKRKLPSELGPYCLLQRCVWDCAQQHLLEGTEAESHPTVCRVRVGKGGRHLHTRVSMRAFAHPFSFPVGRMAPAFQM